MSVILHFESGATHQMSYDPTYPVLGLDPDGRVVVDPSADGLDPFGLTLCCDAFDKGMEDGVFCRRCRGTRPNHDAGMYDPEVVDPFTTKEAVR